MQKTDRYTTQLHPLALALTLFLALGLANTAGCGADAGPNRSDTLGRDGGAANQTDGDGDAPNADTAGRHSGGKSDPLAVPKGGYRAIFIDVGQGDATLLIASTGETLLIDGGRKADLVLQRLVALGVSRLDAVIATHADADHIAGLAKAMTVLKVKTVYWNGLKSTTQVFKTFFEAAAKVTLVAPTRGMRVKFGNLDLEFLHPEKTGAGSDPNTRSLVLLTGCAGAWLLLTGDANIESEASMLKAGVLSDVDVLKVGHHGSKSGTTKAFLDVIRPENAVISAGRTNAYGHPDDVVVKRLKTIGAKVYAVDTTWNDDSLMLTSSCTGSYTIARVLGQ